MANRIPAFVRGAYIHGYGGTNDAFDYVIDNGGLGYTTALTEAGPTTITDNAAGTPFAATDFAAGRLVYINGLIVSAEDGIATISGASASSPVGLSVNVDEALTSNNNVAAYITVKAL